MKHRIIDTLLKTLETKADEIGYDIDSDDRYIAINALLAQMDVDNYSPTYAEKTETDANLKALYQQMDLSYTHIFRATAIQYFALDKGGETNG